MFWFKILAKFIQAMREGQTPHQIAAGFGLGFLIGLMPFFTLQGLLFLLILFFLNVNLAAGTLAILLCSFVAWLFDPLFHDLGYWLLTGIPALMGTWETLYNLPVAPLTRFNNTVVLGSFVCGLVTLFPVYFGMKKFVVLYRTQIEARLVQWKVIKVIKGSKLFDLYQKIRDLGGA
jgi:uncharacterized protein (TIGR03546 family)